MNNNDSIYRRTPLILLAVLVSSLVLFPTVSAEDPCPYLPSGTVNVKMTRFQDPYRNIKWSSFPMHYMEFEFNGITDPSSIIENDKAYYGFCLEEDVTITRGNTYSGELISTYDTGNPDLPSLSWDKINYIINHKQGNYSDVQDAIWIYTNDIDYADASTLAKAMYDEAELNGDGYWPLPGETMAIYIYI